MKKKVLLYSVACLLASQFSMAQAPPQTSTPLACNASNCTAPTSETCPGGGSTVITSFTGATLRSGSAAAANGLYTFYNIATISGQQINATITIDGQVNCNMSGNNASGTPNFSIDDDAAVDQSSVSIASFFAPRITPSGTTLGTTDQSGYVQFTIRFYLSNTTAGEQYTGAAGDDYSTVPSFGGLSGLNYIHYDIDGSTQGSGGWFRETGVVESVAGSVINANIPTELGSYTYTASSILWKGFAGSVCERTGVSRCSQIAAAANFSTPQTKVTFRMGYDYNYTTSTYGTPPTRQYGSRFGCFSFPQQGTLPVKLLSFNGTYKNNNTYLNWAASNQVNFSAYEIERSLNGTDFSAIGAKQKQGNGLETQQYNFSDDLSLLNNDVFFYRLRMIDADGKFNYSNVIMIRKNGIKPGGLYISPSPVVGGTATVRFTATAKSSIELKIVDMSGRVVLKQLSNVYEGTNSITLNNVDRLQPGIYLLQMLNNGELTTAKFSIAR